MPAPFLVRLPVAVTAALEVKATPLSVMMVPPPVPMLMPRLVSSAIVLVVPVRPRLACSAPPFNTRDVAVAVDGAAPRLLSVLMARLPALMVVPPEKVLLPVSVRVPEPSLVREPAPVMTPE